MTAICTITPTNGVSTSDILEVTEYVIPAGEFIIPKETQHSTDDDPRHLTNSYFAIHLNSYTAILNNHFDNIYHDTVISLNRVALELKNTYEKGKEVTLTYFTSYLILISKQTGQAFHESLMHFTKLFFNMFGNAKLNYLISSLPLFNEVLKAVLCDKYTIISKLEEEVIFSLISYCELGTDSKYKFDIDIIFKKADEYIAKNGKFAKEVEATITKIIEKHI